MNCGLLCLQATATLTALDLSGNNMGDGGLVAVQRAIGRSRSLRRLSLAHNALGSKGGLGIADIIRVSTSLRYAAAARTCA